MVVDWTNSERLRLLKLHREGVDWAASAEKMNEEYRERPKQFFNEQNCKAEFDRICAEPCPKQITPEEPTQSYKKAVVIESWITYLKEKVKQDLEREAEMVLVELREKTELIERLMSKDRPSAEEMSARLAQVREETANSNRDEAEIKRMERVEAVLRARCNQIFKERRESDGNADTTMPSGSLSISPTKASSVALQPAFRSPSPLKSPMVSPIRPLAEVIEEADAEMSEMMLDAGEEPKLGVDTPVASPHSKTSSTGKRDKDKASTVSPRTAADRAIGDGGLEEEMEEDDEDDVKDEPMETDESVEEKKEKPASTRKSTRASTASVETTPVRGAKRKDPSPAGSSNSKKEEEGRVRRTSTRGKAPGTPVQGGAASTPTTPLQQPGSEEKEEGAKTRRSTRVEKPEEKEEEEVTKRITRKSVLGKEGDKAEESESKEEVTFATPSIASRTRHHRGSEQIEEKEKSEEPSVPKTRSGHRPSLSAKAGSESKDSPSPAAEKKGKRTEKKEEEVDEKEKDTARGSASKETPVAAAEKTAIAVAAVGGKRDAEANTEVSIRHQLAPPTLTSPSKTRRGTERESPSTPLARKSSRVSSASSNSGKTIMASVEVQTDKVEMRPEDEVYVSYNSNERYFNPVCEIEKGKAKPRKEIKTETDEEKPISRRLRGGELSEDEGGSRSGSFSQSSDRGTPSRRKDGRRDRDQLTLHLDVDDDTGRYWLANGASHVEPIEEVAGPSSAKRKPVVAEISGRRSVSMTAMDPMKAALFKACKDMELHRHSSVFKANVAQKDAPDYYDCVHQPVCLAKMKQDVLDGKINDPVSLMRQFAIMFMNGAMYNSTAHDYWMYAVEMNKETYKPIREILPEMMAEIEELPKVTRARRNNEPAFAKDAVLCDRDRSMTLDRYFKCESVDADTEEMDTSTDDHRALYSRTKVDSTRKRRI